METSRAAVPLGTRSFNPLRYLITRYLTVSGLSRAQRLYLSNKYKLPSLILKFYIVQLHVRTLREEFRGI